MKYFRKRKGDGLDPKLVGKSPQEAIAFSGQDGLAKYIGFWMFSEANDERTFFGSIATAVRQLWGTDAQIEKGTTRYVRKRLDVNGFHSTANDQGLPRWIVPATWAWQEPVEERVEPIAQPEPAPVRTSFVCKECGERFAGDKMALARHVHKAHARRNPGELMNAALEVLKVAGAEGLRTEEVAARTGVDPNTISHPLTRLRKTGKVNYLPSTHTWRIPYRPAPAKQKRSAPRPVTPGPDRVLAYIRGGGPQGVDRADLSRAMSHLGAPIQDVIDQLETEGLIRTGARRKEGTNRSVTVHYAITDEPEPFVPEEPAPVHVPDDPEGIVLQNARVILRPDGKMYRVVRELPDGSVELEPLEGGK